MQEEDIPTGAEQSSPNLTNVAVHSLWTFVNTH